MLKCSNEDCGLTQFEREVEGYTNYTEKEFIDEFGEVYDYGSRDDGDGERTDEGPIRCSSCGALAISYTPEVKKTKKAKNAKMNWKDRID